MDQLCSSGKYICLLSSNRCFLRFPVRKLSSHHRSELARIFDMVIQDRRVIRNGRPETLPGLRKLIERARGELQYRGNSHGSSKFSSNIANDVSVILMSGGLGQSKYITQRIRESLSYQDDMFDQTPEVRIIAEPQLCVCKGLLKNRLHVIFRTQKCNANYGILEYKPYKMFSMTSFIASQGNHVRDIGGSKYTEGVRWLIRKACQRDLSAISLPLAYSLSYSVYSLHFHMLTSGDT